MRLPRNKKIPVIATALAAVSNSGSRTVNARHAISPPAIDKSTETIFSQGAIAFFLRRDIRTTVGCVGSNAGTLKSCWHIGHCTVPLETKRCGPKLQCGQKHSKGA